MYWLITSKLVAWAFEGQDRPVFVIFGTINRNLDFKIIFLGAQGQILLLILVAFDVN